MPLSLFFICGIIACIIVAIVLKAPGIFVIAGLFYIAQLIEGFCSKTRSYISNPVNVKDTHVMIDKLRVERPIIMFSIQNYHYKTVTRRVR